MRHRPEQVTFWRSNVRRIRWARWHVAIQFFYSFFGKFCGVNPHCHVAKSPFRVFAPFWAFRDRLTVQINHFLAVSSGVNSFTGFEKFWWVFRPIFSQNLSVYFRKKTTHQKPIFLLKNIFVKEWISCQNNCSFLRPAVHQPAFSLFRKNGRVVPKICAASIVMSGISKEPSPVNTVDRV